MEIEKRAYMHAPELRAEGDGMTVRGYAAIFNSETDVGGMFREFIRPGAFERSLRNADVRALVDHDSGRVIGRTKAGTLRLSEDERGLAVEIDLPDTSDGRDLAELVRRGDIDGMSFGFRVVSEIWDMTEDVDVREIVELDLVEVSAVAWPIYPDTSLAMRSRDKAKEKTEEEKQEAERKANPYFLRKVEAEQKFRKI